MGYTRPADAIHDHVYEEDKLTRQIDVSGQGRNMYIINESGLYSLILKSRMPLAQEIAFKKWIGENIIPNVRKIYTNNPLDIITKSYISNNFN